jgi:hypothetical protein
LLLFLGLNSPATAAGVTVGVPTVVTQTSSDSATLGIPRWKGYMDPAQPSRFWISYANATTVASNIAFTADSGATWLDTGLNPGANGYLNYHLALFGDAGDLYFTFPTNDGIGVRRFQAPALSIDDAGPLITIPNTASSHRSSVMVDGNGRLWVFTRDGDNASANVRYAWSDDHGGSWTFGVAVATGAPNVRIGSMPFPDGRACLIVLHLNDPRGYEYYLWNGSAFAALPDHSIWAEDVGYDRAFTHNAVGDNLHLIFGRGTELRHVWKKHDGGAGVWQDSVLLTSTTTDGIDMLPTSTVRGDNLYLFYCLKTDATVASSRICARVWSQSAATWGPEIVVSTASTTDNLHPNTCRQVPLASPYVPVFWIAGADGSRIVFNKLLLDTTVSAFVPETPALGSLLLPIYPNPFNPRTIIPFVMARAGPARLTVHDYAGRLVAVPLAGPMSAGRHELVWEGTRSDGRPLPSGAYTVRLNAGGEISTRSIILCR